jgi:hypothetical protein
MASQRQRSPIRAGCASRTCGGRTERLASQCEERLGLGTPRPQAGRTQEASATKDDEKASKTGSVGFKFNFNFNFRFNFSFKAKAATRRYTASTDAGWSFERLLERPLERPLWLVALGRTGQPSLLNLRIGLPPTSYT